MSSGVFLGSSPAQAAFVTGSEPMDWTAHQEIADRLESVKSAGFISDYSVSWIGSGGRLDPVVRAWKSARMSESAVHSRLEAALLGLVQRQYLKVATE